MAYRRQPRRQAYRRIVSRSALEAAMKRADLSGTELAQQAGAHPAYISAIRRGDRSRMNSRTAARIEAALSVPSGTVFSTEEYRRNGRRVGDE